MNTKQNKIMNLLKLPIISYIKRYWILLAATALLIWAYTSGTLALTMRGALLIPIFTLVAAASGLLLRNVFNRRTTDKYVENESWITRDWADLTPFQRILLTKIEYAIYFLGGCVIAAGLVIIINV